MSISRRSFVQTSALGAMGLGLYPRHVLGAMPVPRAETPLRILILGGTGFIGPYQVRYAVARGHQVTVFNRGRSQAELPASVEQLIGDRNDDLRALEGRDWDVVIDNPTTLPKWIADVGPILQDRTRHYVFISSVSVYADTSVEGMDEDTPVLPYQGDEDPMSAYAGDWRAVRPPEGAVGAGIGEVVPRPDHHRAPRPHRGPWRPNGPVHLLAPPDRAGRGRDGARPR
jgi:2'-hydroxyisoflavone reductase